MLALVVESECETRAFADQWSFNLVANLEIIFMVTLVVDGEREAQT